MPAALDISIDCLEMEGNLADYMMDFVLIVEGIKLKTMCDIAVNYECSITNTTQEVSLGDTVNVVDEKSKLFLSARVLKIETSEVDKTKTLTLGDYLIKQSGISEQTRQNITQIITTVIGSRVQEMTAEDVRRICT